MSSLNDIIKLAGEGKVFVVDEAGNVKLVILNVEEYQKLLLGKLKSTVRDIEAINQEILKAQLQDDQAAPEVPSPIGPTVSRRAKELFKSRPATARSQPDLRSEVIDPSFDFEAPKAELEDI